MKITWEEIKTAIGRRVLCRMGYETIGGYDERPDGFYPGFARKPRTEREAKLYVLNAARDELRKKLAMIELAIIHLPQEVAAPAAARPAKEDGE